MNQQHIPRTQRNEQCNNPGNLPMEQHAALLTQALEKLKREMESEESLHRRLKEVCFSDFFVIFRVISCF